MYHRYGLRGYDEENHPHPKFCAILEWSNRASERIVRCYPSEHRDNAPSSA